MRQDTFVYEHDTKPLRLADCARYIALSVGLYAVSMLGCGLAFLAVMTLWHSLM